MSRNPLPLLIVLFIVRNQNANVLHNLNTLQLEAFLDNTKKVLETIDKFSTVTQNIPQTLPDLDNIMKLAGPILSSINNNDSSNSN